MNDEQLQNLWQQYDAKLQKSLKINEYLLENLQTQKARTEINSQIPHKLVGIFIGVCYIWLLAGAVLRHLHQPFFVGSIAMIILVTSFAVIDYIIQIIIIRQLSYSKNIIDTQKHLATLQSSIIRNVRVSLLQLPFYTTFYIANQIIKSASTNFWIFQVCLTGTFVLLTIFVFNTISYKNINKRWVKELLNGSGWKSATKAMNFLNEIEEFKKEK